MAIDSENKRRSVQSYSIGLKPVPDGTVGAPDRAMCAGFYFGLTYEDPTPPVFIAAYLHTRFHLHHNLRPFN